MQFDLTSAINYAHFRSFIRINTNTDTDNYVTVLVCRMDLTPVYHINLSIGVAHVADNSAIFHSVQLVSGHHVLVPYRKAQLFTFKHTSSATQDINSTELKDHELNAFFKCQTGIKV